MVMGKEEFTLFRAAGIQTQFVFFMENSILFATITVSQKKLFQNLFLKIRLAFHFHS